MDIQPKVPFHWCLLSLGIVESPTRGSPTGSGDTISRPSPASRSDSQTPPPYDAYPLSLSLDVEAAADISTHHVGLRTNWSAAGARAADAAATGVQLNLYQRWGDVLAARLAARPQREHKAIANAGIAGNRVLNRGNGPSALERLERDVLDRAGVTHVVFLEGTNDITGNFTAAQIIAGTQQIIDKVRARDIKIIDGGAAPAIPAEWNCDGTHPNAAGYKAMVEHVDLRLFEGPR